MEPIPAIEDTDRLRIYNPVNSAGPFYLGFPLFDGTGADLDVRLDAETVTGWSFSGTMVPGFTGASFTWINGYVVFNSAVTGVLTIEGRRPPRTVSVFGEGRGIPARDMNATLAAMIATQRELYQRQNRSIALPASVDVDVSDLVMKVIRLADSADNIDIVAGIEEEIVYVAGNLPAITVGIEEAKQARDEAVAARDASEGFSNNSAASATEARMYADAAGAIVYDFGLLNEDTSGEEDWGELV